MRTKPMEMKDIEPDLNEIESAAGGTQSADGRTNSAGRRTGDACRNAAAPGTKCANALVIWRNYGSSEDK